VILLHLVSQSSRNHNILWYLRDGLMEAYDPPRAAGRGAKAFIPQTGAK
jgi:hypothetical protein